MESRILVRRNEYHDSVALMRASEVLRASDGILEGAILMGTDANKSLLRRMRLLSDEAADAASSDLLIAAQVADEASWQAVVANLKEILAPPASDSHGREFSTVESAAAAVHNANLAIISVPGEHAARETRKALEAGLHVFLFSDNVTIEDERRLKASAAERGLLVMGPECGTAIINGVGLGFANRVRSGPIGIVGASGTGIQEVTVLIDQLGMGVSHAIGVGGRDLSSEVGAAMTIMALAALQQDAETSIIVLVSKPPAPEVLDTVAREIATSAKPIVTCLLGGPAEQLSGAGGVPAVTLEAAAVQAVALAGGAQGRECTGASWNDSVQSRAIRAEGERFAEGQRFVRGLFSGGSLCYEAALVLEENIGPVYSNAPLRPEYRLEDENQSLKNTLVDMGTDSFTKGRAHPMIDPRARQLRLLQEAEDPEVAVVLLDVVLGFGSHRDPGGALVEPIVEAKARAAESGRYLSVVASVCGTEADPQCLSLQQGKLEDAGVVVLQSNASASRWVGSLLTGFGQGKVG